MSRCLPISKALTLIYSNGRRLGRNKNPNPKWVELPEDLWILILSKLNTFDIMVNAQKVCRLFQKICKRPTMYRIIDMEIPDAYRGLRLDMILLTRRAVDRSAGQLVDIYLNDHFQEDNLMYIALRSPNLRCLRLGGYFCLNDIVIEAVEKVPTLEELEFVLFFTLSAKTIEALGRTLPQLKSLSLVYFGHKWSKIHDKEAVAIAENMPQLRHLQLISSDITNEGLNAILNGCPHLESFLNIVSPSRVPGCYDHLLPRAFRSCEANHQLPFPRFPVTDHHARLPYFRRIKLWLQK